MEFKDKYYRCFSVPLKDFLMSKGFEYEIIALDPKSKDKFWLFIRSKEFNNIVLEWKINNKLN